MFRSAILLVAAAAATTSGPDRVVGNCQHSQVKPAAIVLACADANAYIDKIDWKTFGGTTATGSGDYVENTCTPNCAGGHFKSYPMNFVLSGAKPCFDRHDDYRKLKITFLDKRPSQTPQPFDLPLYCPVG
ncbi:MAG: hypothetical protein ABSC56_09635 [Solirubrobacteraceae bacterium]